MDAAPLRDFAVIVDARDNVAVAKTEIPPGLVVALEGRTVRMGGIITPGNRFATAAIPSGEFVRQYGQPIGTSRGIREGDAISLTNMSNEVPVVRDLDPNLATPAPAYVPEAQRATFMGIRRADGRVATRNFVLVIATISEFTVYSRERYPNVDGVVAIPHNKGCGCSDGSNIDVMLRTLGNYADHPNVGGVIMVELGCEKTNLSIVEEYLHKKGRRLSKPFVRFGIQDAGGTQGTIERGLKEVEMMLPELNRAQRSEVSISELVLGVKCGGSDAFS